MFFFYRNRFLISAPVGSKKPQFSQVLQALEAIDFSETLIVMLVLLSIAPNLRSIPVIRLRLVSFQSFLDLFLMTKTITTAIIAIIAIITKAMIRINAKLLLSKIKTNCHESYFSKNFFQKKDSIHTITFTICLICRFGCLFSCSLCF